MTRVDQIVSDLLFVAKHVAQQPRGYAGFEVDRAQIIQQRVDMEALRATLSSVLFVSGYYAPLTAHEQRVYTAAMRLHRVLAFIEERQQEIQVQLIAA